MIQNNEKYYTISQAAKILDLIDKRTGKINTHTLRFWQKNFKEIKPKLFSGRRRLYNQNDIKILKKIKFLLKEKGMTIMGAKKYLDDEKSNLDELNTDHINTKNNIKLKLKNISNLIKKLKN
tara:strand:- start:524 stop:889 length:366 start_codon:yes stop_codon:yes gene_type:complete